MPHNGRSTTAQHRVYEGEFALDTPGKRIRFIRKQHEMTQAVLADKCFATQAAVSQWENDVWVPSRRSQYLLAEALRVPVTFLFGEVAA